MRTSAVVHYSLLAGLLWSQGFGGALVMLGPLLVMPAVLFVVVASRMLHDALTCPVGLGLHESLDWREDALRARMSAPVTRLVLCTIWGLPAYLLLLPAL